MFDKVMILWRESLAIFKKNNITNFSLAVLQNARLSLTSLMQTKIGGSLMLFYLGIAGMLLYGKFFHNAALLVLITYTSAVFVMHLYSSSRASLEPKNDEYYVHYLQYYLGSWAIILLPLAVIVNSLAPFVHFFYFDTDPSIKNCCKAMYQACVAWWYCLPAMIVFYCIAGIMGAVLIGLQKLLVLLFGFGIVRALLMPFFMIIVMQLIISLYAVFYIRLKHTQRQFFFN